MTDVDTHVQAQNMRDLPQTHWPKAGVRHGLPVDLRDQILAPSSCQTGDTIEETGGIQFIWL